MFWINFIFLKKCISIKTTGDLTQKDAGGAM